MQDVVSSKISRTQVPQPFPKQNKRTKCLGKYSLFNSSLLYTLALLIPGSNENLVLLEKLHLLLGCILSRGSLHRIIFQRK